MNRYTKLAAILFLSLTLVACQDDPGGSNNPDQNNGQTADATDDAGGEDTATADGADDAEEDSGDASDSGPTVDTSPLGPDDREAEVVVPSDYDASQSYPLVFLLHGYTANAAIQDTYFQVSNKVDQYDFVLVLPNGTIDNNDNRFWNATSWCCNFFGSQVDDAAYLEGLMDDAESRFNIDPAKIYFMGHSNGGFMSYRMACDYSDRVAAVASLAGSGFVDADTCDASEPVAVLQAHGTADATISYTGTAGQYPSAEELMERWAARNGCDSSSTDQGDLDLVTGSNGDETDVLEWANCDDGASTVLWKINGGSHIPTVTGNFTTGVLDFLFAHER
ncbi:MAG: alpha/beta hydrolase family esterase [Myxococcota bacterium]